MWRHGALLLVLAGCASGPERADTALGTLVGVWKVAELASRVPGGSWESRGTPHRSQYIFTRDHYSYLYVRGSAPRKTFAGDPNNPDAAEKVEAYDSIVAATGVYTLAGDTLALTALIHKNPNEMLGESLRYTIELEGDTLTMIIADPPFLPGREWKTTLTRVGR